MTYLWRLCEWLVMPVRAILAAPVMLVSAPRRFWGLSLPARVALILGLFLSVVILIDFLAWYHLESRADFGHMVRVLLAETASAAVVCLTLYGLLRLWLQGRPSPFPDIDDAWKQGLAELERRKVDLANLPVFLVLGVPGAKDAAALMRASTMSFAIADVPAGDAPLKWFVSDRGIFLVCTGASRASRAARSAAESPAPAAAAPAATPLRGGPAYLRGTVVAGESGFAPPEAPAETAQSGGRSIDIYNTIVAPDTMQVPGASTDRATGRGWGAARKADAAEEAERLRYVCRLLGRGREPVCPLNGVLAVMPFGVIASGAQEANELQLALRQDVSAIREAGRLRFPVVALVTGMESQNGFLVLIKRIGADNARNKRFGKGYDVWNPPTKEQVEAVGIHACGAFEDWVYQLFGEKDGFQKVDNTKLYALLCRIRSELKLRLTNLLANAFGEDEPERGAKNESALFGGCYFAATGGTDDRQGFVLSVFERLLSEESELEWSAAALQSDLRYQRLALLCMLASGALLAAFGGLVVWKFWA